MDLAHAFSIGESRHRIHDPFDSTELATPGAAPRLSPGTCVHDLACGSGEMLCT